MKRSCAVLIPALVLALAAPAAPAQNIPPQIAERIQEIGPVLEPKMIAETIQLYAPLMPGAPAGIALREDLAYGPDERSRLEVFAPSARPARPMPVVVFVPGGGDIGGGYAGEGERSRAGTGFYRNVGYFFARNGVVGVNMTYRLAPEHPWPAGGEDVAAALRWAKANIQDYGGDPKRLVLYGYAEGATHAAQYVFDKSLHPARGGDGLKGAILQSGMYDAPLFHPLAGPGAEVFLIDAQYDPEPFRQQTEKLRDELCKAAARGCPRHMELAGHNHLSAILHLGTQDNLMGARILDFVRRLH